MLHRWNILELKDTLYTDIHRQTIIVKMLCLIFVHPHKNSVKISHWLLLGWQQLQGKLHSRKHVCHVTYSQNDYLKNNNVEEQTNKSYTSVSSGIIM